MIGQQISLVLAFFAGLASFVSPCVLPLIPSYLGFIGGQQFGSGGVDQKRLIIRTLFFIAGFTLVFVVLGIALSGTAAAFSGASRWITIIAGGIVTVFGLHLMFHIFRFFEYEKRVQRRSPVTGVVSASLLGMAFAAGWSPCIGPILAAILAMAAGTGSAARGTLLLVLYSAGLGVPFLLASVFIGSARNILNRIKPAMPVIQKISGAILVAIGILMMMGQYRQLANWIFLSGFRLESWSTANPQSANLVFTLVAAVPALIIAGFRMVRMIRTVPTVRRDAPDALPSEDTKKTGSKISNRFVSIIMLLSIALAAMQAAGLVDLAGLIASWLSYQGI